MQIRPEAVEREPLAPLLAKTCLTWSATFGRLALFALAVGVCFVAVVDPIEHITPLNYQNWALALAAFLALALVAKWERLRLAHFGLRVDLTAPRDIAQGFLIGAATMGCVVLWMWVAGWYHASGIQYSAEIVQNLWITAGTFFAIGFSEEIIYRGYVLQTLERLWGTDRALATTILVFGLAHLFIDVPAASFMLRLIGALSIAAEAGVLFGAAYLLRRRLWLSIGVHWAWNFVEGPVFGLPVAGGDYSPSLVAGRLTGHIWATGGHFGPEASVPCLIISTLAGLWLLEVGYRHKIWHHGRL